MICIPSRVLSGWSNQVAWDGRGIWHVWSKVFVANLRARSRWNTARKLQENIKRVWENVVGIIWLRVGASGGLLWARSWTFGFRKLRGISWLAVELAASEERLGSIEIKQWLSVCRLATDSSTFNWCCNIDICQKWASVRLAMLLTVSS